MKKILEILDLCCCHFIHEMPFGLDTMLEENGANISGGQRQQLAIARALLRNPQLLILDEATSALDTITKSKIQNGLKKYYPNMTVVMIAHRWSTVKDCHQILVMDHGRIVENGTHYFLLKKENQYARLWNKQNSNVA